VLEGEAARPDKSHQTSPETVRAFR